MYRAFAWRANTPSDAAHLTLGMVLGREVQTLRSSGDSLPFSFPPKLIRLREAHRVWETKGSG